MGITEFLAQYATAFIDKTGYVSVFGLMVLESMVFPIPSEAVMPFAGFLIAESKFTFAMVIAASTAGSILGSLISYCVGRYGGKPFIGRFGKYLLLNMDDLAATERFFTGTARLKISFICRFIPVVRHLISIPAGTGKHEHHEIFLSTLLSAPGSGTLFLRYAAFTCGKTGKRSCTTAGMSISRCCCSWRSGIAQNDQKTPPSSGGRASNPTEPFLWA